MLRDLAWIFTEPTAGRPRFLEEQKKSRRTAGVLRDRFSALRAFRYGLLVLFFFGAGLAVFFLASPSLPPISVNASVALKGNWRTEVWPVVLKVTSTRRLLPILFVTMFLKTLSLSSELRSGLLPPSPCTSSVVKLCSLPNAWVSMLASGTPCSTRKLLVRLTRRSESAWLYSTEPR